MIARKFDRFFQEEEKPLREFDIRQVLEDLKKIRPQKSEGLSDVGSSSRVETKRRKKTIPPTTTEAAPNKPKSYRLFFGLVGIILTFDDQIAHDAVKSRQEEFGDLSDEFLDLAVRRFLSLRDRNLRKSPSTSELLVWLRVLSLAVGQYPKQLEENLGKLPYLGVLLKDHQDIEELGGK